ncbi:NepR family anti-sigma factor [Bosea sp. BK604]|uniref:NepR family anti-sigma factor n=1 Tax=Bosea sp. BK604 TaxID=2512180 RepID=UPI0010D06F8A|nr:NepR family anti-sigma factor [Bosea sp. BK604]TCR68715.1 hypothetical protein EV560_102544 [Bosea sp. BK604]
MSDVDLEMTEPDRGDDQELEPILDPKVQESIGRSLKAHYDDLVNAPIPDKFLVLLAQLEAQEQRASAGGTTNERL